MKISNFKVETDALAVIDIASLEAFKSIFINFNLNSISNLDAKCCTFAAMLYVDILIVETNTNPWRDAPYKKFINTIVLEKSRRDPFSRIHRHGTSSNTYHKNFFENFRFSQYECISDNLWLRYEYGIDEYSGYLKPNTGLTSIHLNSR